MLNNAMRVIAGIAIMAMGAGVCFAGTVTLEESVVSFAENTDRFRLPWHARTCDIRYDAAHVMHLTGTNASVYIHFFRSPGPRPFRGPHEIRLESFGANDAAVELIIKNRDTGKTKKVRAPWRETTSFTYDLPKDEAWQFHELGFVFPRKTVFDISLKRMVAVSQVTPAEALSLEADTGSPLHVTTDPKARPVDIVLGNASLARVACKGYLTAENYFHENVSLSAEAELDAGDSQRMRLDVTRVKHPYGIWRVRGVFNADGTTATNETRFAVLNPNRRTPRLPNGRFKMGINYHMSSMTPGDQLLTLEALNACGCKLVRAGGWSADGCWSEKEKLDFSRADRQMDLLKKHGLSLNTDCWPNAQWMAKPENRNKPYRVWRDSRTLPGVMGDYAGRLAARFGTDIEFLETSNEADFWKDGMTAEEYIEYQKEVYTAVKRAAPGIKVLPSAFAVGDSSHPSVVRKGYQETILTGAKGFYDVHAVHLHLGFGAYESDILTKFFPMRAKHGVTVPWYANETALTSVNGAEDGVALNVWMKILFSWAHGSVSYIWYNLRATGWNPRDPEQGYGLLTADLHPRAGFAAFSALAYAVSELEFDRILDEHKGRHLYAFKGWKVGRTRRVIAGWDGHTDPPHPIRVATDAKTAWTIDLMGNVAPADSCAGGYVMPISKHPGALVLEDVTTAEPNADDAKMIPRPNIKARELKAQIDGRPSDWHLYKWWHVRDLYAGNPETINRTWQGPQDHSVAIWVGRSGKDLRFRFKVRDDIHFQQNEAQKLYLGDGLQFILESPMQSGNFEFGLSATDKMEPLVYTWIVPAGFDAAAVTKSVYLQVTRAGEYTTYEARIPMSSIGFDEETLSVGFRFNAIVYDDDGVGKNRDSWIEIVPGIAGKKEYSDSPFVKIVE